MKNNTKSRPNSLETIRKERGLTMQKLADLIGTDASTISKLEKGTTALSDSWLRKLSDALDVTVDEILREPSSTSLPSRHSRAMQPATRRAEKSGSYVGSGLIPLFGFAAGSLAGEAQMLTDVIDELPAPPALLHVRDAYVLLTRNESMSPRYMPNEPLYVHPYQAVRPGDHVVIQVQTHEGGPIETWIKRFDTETADEITVSQYNPPSRIIYKKRFVKAVHRVLPPGELF